MIGITEQDRNCGRVRWALSGSELQRIDSLASNDELLATYQPTIAGMMNGDAVTAVVLRDGTVTNRFHDGTVGVPERIRQLLESEDTLYHEDLDGETEPTLLWLDVLVTPDGKFVAAVDQAALSKAQADMAGRMSRGMGR